VQLALEILTGVCATLPDPDLGPSVDDEIEDEALMDGDADDSAMDETPDEPMALDEVPGAKQHPRAKRTFVPPDAPRAPSDTHPAHRALLLRTVAPPADDLGARRDPHSRLRVPLQRVPRTRSRPAAAASDIQVGQRVWAAVWTALAGAGSPAEASRAAHAQPYGTSRWAYCGASVPSGQAKS
jgi:hypothetical protein